MFSKRIASAGLSPRQMIAILGGLLCLVASLSFGSFWIEEKDLMARRGPLAAISRETRTMFVAYRIQIGLGAAAGFMLLSLGWAMSEMIARRWQKTRNRELAQNGIVIRLAPRAEMKTRWEAAADLWRAVHSTMARSGRETWLGAGYHLSFEVAQKVGEQLTFYLWTPTPLAQTMVRQLQAGYPGLEIEVLSDQTQGAGDYLDVLSEEIPLAWADLGLDGPSWQSLRTEFAGDPLVAILSTLEGLSSGVTLAGMQVVVRPAGPGWQSGGRAHLAKLRGDNLKPSQPRPRLGSEEKTLLKNIETKLTALGYDVCLRLYAGGQGDVGDNLSRLIYAFSQYDGDNRLVVRSQGDQTDHYRVQGRFLPAGWKASVLSERELAGLAHLPNKEVSGLNLDRAGVQLNRPSPVCFVEPGEARIVLGSFADVPVFAGGLSHTLEYPFPFLRQKLGLVENPANNGSGRDLDARPVVGIKPQDGRRHFHVIGPTGVGKSTMLLNMMVQYMAKFSGAAIWLQEPHQDLTHKVVLRVPLSREKDVIWLDVMDEQRVLGINPLEAPEGAELGQVVADVMGVMRKAMGASWDTAVQMQEILDNALQVILRVEKTPTMVHLFKMLADEAYRFEVTAQVEDPLIVSYWDKMADRKEKELDQMFSVPLRRIRAFINNPIVRRIVAQPTTTVNFREAIDTNKIILVQLDGRMGPSNRTFVGAMMMYQLFGAIMSRMDIPEEERKQVAICVDEFQTFVGQSSDEFADILEQARKMGASLTLAHQHLGQLGELTRSVANNTGTKIVFRAEASDAPTFLKWLPELSTIEALTKMKNYWCYVRPLVNGSPQPVCTLKTFADPPIPDPAEELRSGQRGRPDPLPSHPGQEALAELDKIRALASDEARKETLKQFSADEWARYLAARKYRDAVMRNQLIENPEKMPDKMQRIRTLVRLGYGTPHYETEAQVEALLAT